MFQNNNNLLLSVKNMDHKKSFVKGLIFNIFNFSCFRFITLFIYFFKIHNISKYINKSLNENSLWKSCNVHF